MQGKLTRKKEVIARQFARRWPKHDFNGTKTMQELKPHLEANAAGVAYARLIGNDNARSIIIEELEKIGVDDEYIARIHKRNIIQEDNIAASNVAIDMAYKLKRAYPKEDVAQQHLHIHLTDEELKQKVKELSEAIGTN